MARKNQFQSKDVMRLGAFAGNKAVMDAAKNLQRATQDVEDFKHRLENLKVAEHFARAAFEEALRQAEK